MVHLHVNHVEKELIPQVELHHALYVVWEHFQLPSEHHQKLPALIALLVLMQVLLEQTHQIANLALVELIPLLRVSLL
jgi:hypothetical protein